MSSTQLVRSDRFVPESVSGPVVGGLASTVLALLHLFAVPLGGLAGLLLYLVVWPALGGAAATAVTARRDRDASVAGVLAGAYGAVVLSVLVLLTGVAGLWSALIHTTFGVVLWPVVFAVLVVTTLSWAIVGWASGTVTRQLLAE
jgi:hypothetical protein